MSIICLSFGLGEKNSNYSSFLYAVVCAFYNVYAHLYTVYLLVHKGMMCEGICSACNVKFVVMIWYERIITRKSEEIELLQLSRQCCLYFTFFTSLLSIIQPPPHEMRRTLLRTCTWQTFPVALKMFTLISNSKWHHWQAEALDSHNEHIVDIGQFFVSIFYRYLVTCCNLKFYSHLTISLLLHAHWHAAWRL